MDPVSVFNALYDTKCLTFADKSATGGNNREAPYLIDLTPLPLHPKLFNAVVAQVVDRFLTSRALVATKSQLRRQTSVRTPLKQAIKKAAVATDKCAGSHSSKLGADKQISPNESDADSQLEDDDTETNSDTDEEWEKVCDNSKTILFGAPGAAAALAASIAYKAQLPYLPDGIITETALDWIRQQQQPNGHSDSADKTSSADEKRIGEKRARVVLIENAICSGKNILDTVKSIEKHNLKVEFVICIVDHEESGADNLFEQEGIRVVTLYNMSAILRILETTGRITSEQFISTRHWMSKNRCEPTVPAASKCPLPPKVAQDIASYDVRTKCEREVPSCCEAMKYSLSHNHPSIPTNI